VYKYLPLCPKVFLGAMEVCLNIEKKKKGKKKTQ
jgi:hypothetical protein